MKLSQLYEAVDSSIQPVAGTPEEIALLLMTQCSEAVAAYAKTHKVLYRGIKSMTGVKTPAILADIKTERTPLYATPEIHNAINEAMLELGLKAHRGNSIFCTTRLSIASTWGQTYAVFPTDGWVGTVFDKVVDGYVIDEILDDVKWIMKSTDSRDIKLERIAAKLAELEPYSFKSTNSLEFILKHGFADILITGNKYYGLLIDGESQKDNLTDKIFDILGI